MVKKIDYSLLNPQVLNVKRRLQIAKQVLSVLKIHLWGQDLKKLRVLDVGCSGGIITSYMANEVKYIIGVDNDQNAINWGKKMFKKKNLKYLKMDAAKMNFANNSFDVVVCNQVYVDLVNPGKMFSEIYRVLKNGGVCFLGAVNKYQILENQYKLPFISFLPIKVSKMILKLLGREENFILGSYKSYWELKRLCKSFQVYPYTPKILKNPKLYNFTNLEKWQLVLTALPSWVWKFLEPFSPNFIWILKKP